MCTHMQYHENRAFHNSWREGEELIQPGGNEMTAG